MKELNPCMKIILDNCKTYKERQEFYDYINEGNHTVNNINTVMVADLYAKISDRAVGDVIMIEKSKGNIKDFVGYEDMIECVSIIDSMMKRYSTSQYQDIMTVKDCISNLEFKTPFFVKAYKTNNDVMKIYYNSLVMSCLLAISTLINSYVFYLKSTKPLKNNMIIHTTISNSHGYKLMTEFNSSINSQNFDKLANELMTSNFTNNDKGNTLVTETLGSIIIGLTIIASIIPILRNVVYFFYFSRVKIVDFLHHEALFLELNKAQIELTVEKPSKRKAIIAKQEKIIKQLNSIADKIKVDDKITSAKVQSVVKSENQQWTLDTVKNEEFGLL